MAAVLPSNTVAAEPHRMGAALLPLAAHVMPRPCHCSNKTSFWRPRMLMGATLEVQAVVLGQVGG